MSGMERDGPDDLLHGVLPQSPFGNAKPREAVIAGRVGKSEEEVLKEEVNTQYKLHVRGNGRMAFTVCCSAWTQPARSDAFHFPCSYVCLGLNWKKKKHRKRVYRR